MEQLHVAKCATTRRLMLARGKNTASSKALSNSPTRASLGLKSGGDSSCPHTAMVCASA
jgi:hypothetical protein